MPNATSRQRIQAIPGTLAAYRAWLCIWHALRRLWFWTSGGTRYAHATYSVELAGALANKKSRTDISDHLGTLFFLATGANPKLIVELGTRGGESTHTLLAAASLTGATVLSIDVVDCSGLPVPYPDHWNFIQADDVEFGRNRFSDWCGAHALVPLIDVLFIDTSHEYEHTVRELKTWAPYVAHGGFLILHDTNMGHGVFGRNDGSVGFGWDNQRGVMRAVEEFVGRNYDGNKFFCDATGSFVVLHFPNCSGLTVLQRRERANGTTG